MQRLELGKTGLEVPRIVLGCGNFGGIGSAPDLFGQGESEEEAFRIMDAAWEQEITAFDTATPMKTSDFTTSKVSPPAFA